MPAGTSNFDPKLVMAVARPYTPLGRLVCTVVVIGVLQIAVCAPLTASAAITGRRGELAYRQAFAPRAQGNTLNLLEGQGDHESQ